MSNKIQKNKIKDFFNKLKFRKIDQYAVVEQTIPVFYFMMMAIFIETRWASNLIGFISYMICSLVIIVGRSEERRVGKECLCGWWPED